MSRTRVAARERDIPRPWAIRSSAWRRGERRTVWRCVRSRTTNSVVLRRPSVGLRPSTGRSHAGTARSKRV